MINMAIHTFYLTEEHLTNSPSRKDAIDEETEITLRVYGCDLIQESGILLRLPQAVMATAQVLFQRGWVLLQDVIILPKKFRKLYLRMISEVLPMYNQVYPQKK